MPPMPNTQQHPQTHATPESSLKTGLPEGWRRKLERQMKTHLANNAILRPSLTALGGSPGHGKPRPHLGVAARMQNVAKRLLERFNETSSPPKDKGKFGYRLLAPVEPSRRQRNSWVGLICESGGRPAFVSRPPRRHLCWKIFHVEYFGRPTTVQCAREPRPQESALLLIRCRRCCGRRISVIGIFHRRL